MANNRRLMINDSYNPSGVSSTEMLDGSTAYPHEQRVSGSNGQLIESVSLAKQGNDEKGDGAEEAFPDMEGK